MKIAVITDSGSGLSFEQAKTAGLFLLPLQIMDGTKNYRDCYDIQTLDVYEMLKNGIMPKTSSPTIQDVNDTIQAIKKLGYDEIIAVPLSSGLSGTHQVITMVANDFNIPLTTIEIYSTCNIQRQVALEAKRLVDEGKSSAEIKTILDTMVKTNTTLILPNDLQHLKRGGRLTPIAASLASLLKIKPILCINPKTQGKIDVQEKVRTEHKAIQYSVDYLCGCMEEGKHYHVFVIHSNCKDKAETIANMFKATKQNIDVEIDYISSVIASHTGLNCIALQIIEKI
ncbi:MAG: DegV family protein [Erysipelotrichia bacterium]|nr:DegV family protein [Erysipelotrichia bacterium]NCC55015.1 DegV family protein [Erysipelotrichia bacterium]